MNLWHPWNLKHCKSGKLLLWHYSYLSVKSHSGNMCSIFLYVSIMNQYWQVWRLALCYLDTNESHLRRTALNWENMLIWLSYRKFSFSFSWLPMNVGGPTSLRMRPLFGNGPGWYKIARWGRYGEYASNWYSSRTWTSVPASKSLTWGPALIAFNNELWSKIESRSKPIQKLLLIMLFNHGARIPKTARPCHYPLC